MEIGKYSFPDELYYHKEHCWAKVEGDEVVVGITDFTQQLAGEIKRIATLEEEDEVTQDKPYGTVSSGKWTGKIYSPVSGEITEINEDIEDNPKLANDDPYGEGWIIKISPSNLEGDLAKLMKTGPEFETYYNEQIKLKEAEMK
ncbi:MAG: glycine cleavage system protein GcvH [Thermoplasmatales archaeon]|nr:MAG: glycine cleavage system protein GcvH [Thermoplasmatales archaeon]